MDEKTALYRLGKAVRQSRVGRGLTQARLADLAGLPRLKVIQVEKGEASVAIKAYAGLASALGMELTLAPARRPTLDEVAELLANE